MALEQWRVVLFTDTRYWNSARSQRCVRKNDTLKCWDCPKLTYQSEAMKYAQT